MATATTTTVKDSPNPLKAIISKELQSKANEFLNSRLHANNLVDIITHLEECIKDKKSLTASILTLEVIFVELLKRREMCIEIVPLKPKGNDPEIKYREWLLLRYEEALKLIVKNIEHEKSNEATQALSTSVKLLSAEGKYPLDKSDPAEFPKQRLRIVLFKLLSPRKEQTIVIQRFKEYAEYLDIVFYSWKLMHDLATRSVFKNETFALNYLELINALAVTKDLLEDRKELCSINLHRSDFFGYETIRKCINKVWNCIMLWSDGIMEPVHKQVLIVLLERVLPHLEKPILLTDFLMDSLDCGGPISLLALQGIFTLIQKHNITYPNIYEKLYSMFEPEIFHTKFKARLFYLADIFLSSTHLPENLVAAFVKRLSRLSLIAPPQDAVIILYFIRNLMLRHPGLKRLIYASNAAEVSRDPFIMEEREPTKSQAIESSLWEIVALQKHAVPSIATAAKSVFQPQSAAECDLASVLEMKEDDIFDQELTNKSKQFALAFERPQSLFLPKNDKVVQYWKLF